MNNKTMCIDSFGWMIVKCVLGLSLLAGLMEYSLVWDVERAVEFGGFFAFISSTTLILFAIDFTNIFKKTEE
jgi:hypothetical protein